MALERSTYKWGGTTYPLAAARTNAVLRDADPALYYTIDYLAWVLQADLGARWSAECLALGVADWTARAGNIVQATAPYDPGTYLKSSQIKFPLLAIYRVNGREAEQSVQWERTDSLWGLDLVFPTLVVDQAEVMTPLLNAAVGCITHRLTEGFDVAYTPPGGAIGTEPFSGVNAGLQEIGLIDYRAGNWSVAQGLSFPALHCTLKVIERQGVPAGAFDPLAGVDVTIAIRAADGTTTADVADFKT